MKKVIKNSVMVLMTIAVYAAISGMMLMYALSPTIEGNSLQTLLKGLMR